MTLNFALEINKKRVFIINVIKIFIYQTTPFLLLEKEGTNKTDYPAANKLGVV
jgi:hypothetical protein